MSIRKLNWLLIGALTASLTANAAQTDVRKGKVHVVGKSAKFKTISDALANADDGDTVRVKPGVYNENITLVMDVVVESEKWQDYRAPLRTIIDGGRRGATVNGTTGAVLRGFTIRNGIEGVLCENAAPQIYNNWIIDNHATGVAAFISVPKLRNNVIYGNRWSGVLVWGGKSLNDFGVTNNVIMRSGFSGLTLKGPTNINVAQNIFMENHFYGIFADPAAGQTRVNYNNLKNNYYPYNRFIKVPRTNRDLIPKFINPSLANPNFYTKKNSNMDWPVGKERVVVGLTKQAEKQGADFDGDGIRGYKDRCPRQAEDKDGYKDEDGCPDLDNDGDGIEDKNDKCPRKAESRNGILDEDGCPEIDTDGDGVYDSEDKCPAAAETKNEFKDDDGCPDEVPSAPADKFVAEGIKFESGSSKVSPASEEVLQKIVDQLEAFSDTKFTIIGYTDNRGNRRRNTKLSKERAQSVKEWLVSKGIDGSRLKVKGLGPKNPIASNKNAAGRAKNRRIEFVKSK